ncbi:Perchlorate reductase subunit gamma [bacterium HR17]|uniref:Perchlorate reductase subunit gamma n=1 Tax=Candidatus Fervidibacter japonicus TaxID=2035412 RepID=A0A2H5XA03_9BACT|nr:Perchlorate reductase subunit gamma [bacterium HR17]
MTQQNAQQRVHRLGLLGVLFLAILFAFIVVHQLRQQRPAPPQITLPKEPATLMLLFTANRQGKLEVCGCPGKRAEDLARVAALLRSTVDQARRQGTPVALIEGGDFVGEPDGLSYLLQAYQVMGYRLVALSPRDAKRVQQIRVHAGKMALLPPHQNHAPLPHQKLPLGDWTVIVVNLGAPPSVGDEKFWQAVTTQLKRWRRPHTVIVAIAYTDRNAAEALAQRLNGVVDSLLIDDALPNPNGARMVEDGNLPAGRFVGKVLLASLPQSRAQVLSLMIWAKGKEPSPTKVEAMTLSAFGQSPEPQVKAIVDAYYTMRQKKLEREMQKLLTVAQKRDYVSPEFCGSCHQAQYDQWLTTKHAKAIETLKKANRMDKQCLTCHSLEFKMRGVVTRVEKRGVECVDCHTELADPATARLHGQRPGERPSTQTVTEQICVRCHDAANSPNFNYSTYLPKVTH